MQLWLLCRRSLSTHVLPLIGFSIALLFLLAACGINSGQWQKSTAPSLRMQAVAVDPTNTNKVYVGSAQGTVFMSNDAGDHWSAASMGLPTANVIDMLAFDPNGTSLYAATQQGLFRSVNGQPWQRISAKILPTGGYTALAFDTKHPSVIYAGAGQSSVYMSKDGGQSWQAMQANLPSELIVHSLTYDPNQQQLWAATSAGIYRMGVQQASWTELNTGLGKSRDTYAVMPASLTEGAQDRIYAATQHGFFISTDNGKHWLNGQESINGLVVYSIFEDFRDTSAKTLYLGTSIGVLRSVDQGQTWDMVAEGWPRNVASPALDVGGANFARLFAVGEGVYFYPGVGSSSLSSQLFPIILVVIFFVFLYVFIMRSRRRGPTTKPPVEEQQPAQ
jgi:photosystem II stability/assembly factor-like uncharacterized protein